MASRPKAPSEMAASGRGAEPLVRDQCGRGLTRGVIGQAVAGFWVAVDCEPSAGDVTFRRSEERNGGLGIGGNTLQVAIAD